MYKCVESCCGNQFIISFWLLSRRAVCVLELGIVQNELDPSVGCICSACLSLIDFTITDVCAKQTARSLELCDFTVIWIVRHLNQLIVIQLVQRYLSSSFGHTVVEVFTQ